MLYADDTLLYLSQPEKNPVLSSQASFKVLGSFWGYQDINMQKIDLQIFPGISKLGIMPQDIFKKLKYVSLLTKSIPVSVFLNAFAAETATGTQDLRGLWERESLCSSLNTCSFTAPKHNGYFSINLYTNSIIRVVNTGSYVLILQQT